MIKKPATKKRQVKKKVSRKKLVRKSPHKRKVTKKKVVKKKNGRPTKLTPELKKKASDYIDNYRDYDHAVPSIVGLANILKIGKSTIYDWKDEERDKEFSDTLERLEDNQHLGLINSGLNGDFNPNITKLMLGNHGYSDKTQNDVTSGGKPINDWHIHPVSSDKE